MTFVETGAFPPTTVIICGMRREWQDAVDHRRWDEFERLIKWEPGQELCDTLAALATQVTDKADRKALKKLLWILEKEGYRPLTTLESEPEVGKPLRAAFMMSADVLGDTPITYGHETGGKFRWLTAYVHDTAGLKRASDDTMALDEARQRIDMLQVATKPPYLSAPIDPDFALWRIKRALAKNKPGTIPPAIALWRSIIDRAEKVAHPADSLEPGVSTPGDADVLLMDSTLTWRLELGAATTMMEAMYEANEAVRDADEETQSKAVKEAGLEARQALLTPEVLAEHAMRLRDLAMLFHHKGDPTYGTVLTALKDLEENGPTSDYAKGLVEKTIVLYMEMMKRRASEDQR